MEYLLSSFATILFTFLLLIFAALRIKRSIFKSNNGPSTLNPPPGPRKLPLIGNIHLLVGHMPHRRLRDLAGKHGPVMHLQLGEISQVIISSPEAAMEMMKDNDTCFLQRPDLLITPLTYNRTDIAFAPYGDYWRQVRKICSVELLSMKRVQSYRSLREEVVASLIASISSSPAGLPINMTREVFSLMANIVAKTAFGRSCRDQEAFIQVAQKLMNLAGAFSLVDFFPSVKLLQVLSGTRSELEKFGKEINEIAENIIHEHRASMGDKDEADDLVRVLLNLQDQGLTTDNVKAILLDLFIAGVDTTSTLIEWILSELVKNPRVLEKAQAEVRKVCQKKRNVDEGDIHELQYLKLVIKETLRFHPPAPTLLPRECIKACKLLGYDIPVGSRVTVNAWAIGRDPRFWTEADRFYPERFLDSSIDYKGKHFELIPFGSGRRICPGLSFGTTAVELPVAQMLYHFDWKLGNGVDNQDIDMDEIFGATVHRKNDLYLILSPHVNGIKDTATK